MERKHHPKIIDIVKQDPWGVAQINLSFLIGRHRDFIKDASRFTQRLEPVVVIGTEYIPLTPCPLIVASNHPRGYDTLLGVSQITKTISEVKDGYPNETHWMVAQNFPSAKSEDPIKKKLGLRFINWFYSRIHQTYDFIPVYINYDDPTKGKSKRGESLSLARRRLLDPHGSQIVGIFPEGNFESDDGLLLPFFDGVGALARCNREGDVLILPTGIHRNQKQHLTVEFGEPLTANRTQSSSEITNNLRIAISRVSHRRIS